MAPRGSRIVNDRRVFGIEPRVPERDVQARIVERDKRLGSDRRSNSERMLGDPPFNQSALGQRAAAERPVDVVIRQLIAALRARTHR